MVCMDSENHVFARRIQSECKWLLFPLSCNRCWTTPTPSLERFGNEVSGIVNTVRILWSKCIHWVARMGRIWPRHLASNSICLAFPLLHLCPLNTAPLNTNPDDIESYDIGSQGLSSLQKERHLFAEGSLHSWMTGYVIHVLLLIMLAEHHFVGTRNRDLNPKHLLGLSELRLTTT